MPAACVEIPQDTEDAEMANEDDTGNHWGFTCGHMPGLSTFNAEVA
jgi:hypothetical protein